MKEYKINELTSSRMMYDKNPPRFMLYITIVLLILLITVIVASCFLYKTEVVRTSGIISSSDKSYIMSQTSGMIDKVYYKSGDYVKEGDLLFELDTNSIDSQIIAYKSKRELVSEYVNNYDLIINFLNEIDFEKELINPFSEGEFYYQMKGIIEGINSSKNKEELVEQYLYQMYQSKFQYVYELEGINAQIESYENMYSNYKVYAKNDGYVNYATNLLEGLVIGNDSLGTISSELTKNNAIIETFVDVSSKSFINIGMDVEMVVGGLNQQKYGALKGKIIDISRDSIISEENVLYKVVIKPDDICLKDVSLTNGQALEIRIKYESITWMNWMLEKIGIMG